MKHIDYTSTRFLKPYIEKKIAGGLIIKCWSIQVLDFNNMLDAGIRKTQKVLEQSKSFDNIYGYFEAYRNSKRFYVREDCIEEFNEKVLNTTCVFSNKKDKIDF